MDANMLDLIRKLLDLATANNSTPQAAPANAGRHVLVRTCGAGVHLGTLVSADGKTVTLRDAVRLWRWRGANTLHEVATKGVATDYTRISEPVSEIALLDGIEIIPTTEAARATFAPRWPS